MGYVRYQCVIIGIDKAKLWDCEAHCIILGIDKIKPNGFVRYQRLILGIEKKKKTWGL